jgi:predicted metal-dependent hydrolase
MIHEHPRDAEATGGMMQVRYPKFDFSNTSPHWCENPEHAQIINGGNIIPAYIEPFLIRVLRRAKQELDPVADAQLIADIDLFNKQEGQHLKMHGAMMTMLRNNGYEGMKAIEDAYQADYERFLKEKSLPWLLAYSDGFEASGASAAQKWVDGAIEKDLKGADPQVVELFRWHLAEEYEHRTVCHQLYRRLGQSGGPVKAYFRRIRMVFFAGKHMHGYAEQLGAFLLAKDREGMSPAELEASKAREAAARKAAKAAPTARDVVRILMPWYDPEKTPRPQQLESVLATYSSTG